MLAEEEQSSASSNKLELGGYENNKEVTDRGDGDSFQLSNTATIGTQITVKIILQAQKEQII